MKGNKKNKKQSGPKQAYKKKLKAILKTGVSPDIASSGRWSKDYRRHRNRKLGKFGAASEVRNIDPATGEEM